MPDLADSIFALPQEKAGQLEEPPRLPNPTARRAAAEGGESDGQTVRPLRCEAAKRPAHIPLTQPLQRPVAQLADPLARDAEHRADLLERVLASAFKAEVEAQHLGVARRQGAERLLDLVGEEAVHRLL